jgi:demethylmenaquinone methyltransferase/2-methoxy-6-polyprenyl-1,4-benzoquinol methylase
MDDIHTHFGFDVVPISEKTHRVRSVFSGVAARYDVMNDLMSVGVHRLWKAALVDLVRPRDQEQILDLAGGTGDIARAMAQRLGSKGRVVLCDINADMLTAGRQRTDNHDRSIDWVCGDAEALPLPDNHFDVVTISFGIRNVTRLATALTEIHRVLKPGGRFYCLEFSRVAVDGLRKAYDRYSFTMLPALGQLVAGNADAYRYLAESIRCFPDQDAYAAMLADAGFAAVRVRNLSAGIAAIHNGWRL